MRLNRPSAVWRMIRLQASTKPQWSCSSMVGKKQWRYSLTRVAKSGRPSGCRKNGRSRWSFFCRNGRAKGSARTTYDKPNESSKLWRKCSKIVSIEKHLQHGKDVYNIFMDFNKAFDRIWHYRGHSPNHPAAIHTIYYMLYTPAFSAQREIRGSPPRMPFFLLLSPLLLNIYLEMIMRDIRCMNTTPPCSSEEDHSATFVLLMTSIMQMAGSNDELQAHT